MRINHAILAERARHTRRNIPATALTNLTGACTTTAVFWGAVEPVYLVLWLGGFVALTLYWFRVNWLFRGSAFTPERSHSMFRQLCGIAVLASVAWSVGMFFFFPKGELVQQFAFLCAVVLLGVTSAISFTFYYPAFLCAFVLFALSAVYIIATQKVIFYSALLSVMMFTPMLVIFARHLSLLLIRSLQLRFENDELVIELKQQKNVAELATLAKSRFLAAASHDLRQPIHAQGLFLEVLARSELSVFQHAVLANARSAATASAEMLDTLLDFSRIEAGVVDAQIRPFHLQPLLNKIEHELAPQANAKGLYYRTRETYAAVQSDPALVELVLRNLVTNAIRYTERGGLLVACRTQGSTVQLEVWDTGIGIDATQHRDIFREFHQLGNTERDRTKGLGLGLSIVDGLARTLGHALAVSSTPGRGSVFRLDLPKAQMAVIHEELEAVPVSMRKLNLRVLVVDDDEAVRAGMLHLLVSWGCQCEAVESIDEALQSARAQRPDMVISDYRLREHRTGAEAIAALRAELGPNLPAILITGDTAPERLRDARASGIPLLHKPVAPTQLYRRLVDVLREHRAPLPAEV